MQSLRSAMRKTAFMRASRSFPPGGCRRRHRSIPIILPIETSMPAQATAIASGNAAAQKHIPIGWNVLPVRHCFQRLRCAAGHQLCRSQRAKTRDCIWRHFPGIFLKEGEVPNSPAVDLKAMCVQAALPVQKASFHSEIEQRIEGRTIRLRKRYSSISSDSRQACSPSPQPI